MLHSIKLNKLPTIVNFSNYEKNIVSMLRAILKQYVIICFSFNNLPTIKQEHVCYFYNIEKSSFYLRFIIKILLKNMWKITKLLFIMIL